MQTIDVAKLVLVLLSVFLILGRWKRFQGTTLVAPAVWSIVALAVVALVELILATTNLDPAAREKCHYLAATSTFCPLMAVLGAKRPQDKGWQWIVISLWVVLMLPVAETFIWRSGALTVGPFRRWFAAILMLVGCCNYALTRFGLAAAIFTVGQACLLLPQLPVVGRTGSTGWMLGIVLVCISIGLAFWQTRKEPASSDWNQVWIDFRDAYGLVWGLRVMERINGTAKVAQWQTELGWFGFDKLEADSGKRDELDRTVHTVLRRFVSPEWIAKRHVEELHVPDLPELD